MEPWYSHKRPAHATPAETRSASYGSTEQDPTNIAEQEAELLSSMKRLDDRKVKRDS